MSLVLTTPGFSQIKIQKTIGVQDGLVHPSVNCMFQDSQGYLWIGTNGGLSRWDGLHWLSLQTQDGLPGSTVNDIVEDKQGKIIVATGAGVAFVENGVITGRLDRDHGLANDKVLSIHLASDGKTYFGTWGGGVSVFRDGELVRTLQESDGLANDIVMDIAEDSTGTLYFATWGGGVCRYRDGSLIAPLNRQAGLVNDHVWSIDFTRSATLCIGTWDGFSLYDKGRFESFKDGGLKNFDVFDTCENASGTIYLATSNGVFTLRSDTLQKELGVQHGLADPSVRSIFLTPQGRFFLGTRTAGIFVHHPGVIVRWNEQTGLPGKIVTALHHDARGTIYAGTRNHGTVFLDGQTLPDTFEDGPDAVGKQVTSICEDRSGQVFVGSFDGGVAVYKDRRLLKILNLRNGLRTNRVQSVYGSQDGTLYVGTWEGGVTLFRNLRYHKTLTTEDGLAGNSVEFVYEDADGTLYFSCPGSGVSRFKQGTFLPPLTAGDGLASNSVTSIFQHASGAIVFGTWGAGLSIWHDGEFESLNVTSGLASNIIYAIAGDAAGHIYLNTAKGLNVVQNLLWERMIRLLDSRNGLGSDSVTGGLFADRDGRIWIGTADGVTRYDASLDRPNSVPPRVHITGVRLFNEAFSGWHKGGARRFTHDQNFLGFDFVGINLGAPERVRLQHRLTGVDREWIASVDNSVQYANLGDGDYVFEVRARNEYGAWSKSARLDFLVRPPFWKTWWFRAALVLSLLGLAWLAYRIRVSRLLAFEQLRTRIASDLHDDIGATLTHIGLSSEVILATDDALKASQHASKIGRLSREVTQTFADIVWSIDARNDTIGELLGRMKDHAHQTLAPAEIAYQFDVSGLDESKALPVDLRQNIYLIYRETITNIVKHSTATEVAIALVNTTGGFTMVMQDNGVGMSTPNKQRRGGIRNMHMRAGRIGGEVRLENGTGLRVTFKRKAI